MSEFDAKSSSERLAVLVVAIVVGLAMSAAAVLAAVPYI